MSAARSAGWEQTRTEASHSIANTVVVCACTALPVRAGLGGSDTASASSNVSL